jgi:uncharacterized protein YbjT (DUF2867 family)
MIVVTGATGNVGGPLVRELAAGGEQVVAVSRTHAELPAGVRHVAADLADADALRSVAGGADAVFLMVPGMGLAPHDLLDAVKSAGVRRVVLMTSLGVRTRPGSASHGGYWRAFEDALTGSGLAGTILRPGGFASNAYQWAESVRSSRTVSAPFGDVALPVVDPADIAAVAAAVLRGDGHAGRTYELTGPAPVSPRAQAAALGAAIGEPVRFVELSRAEARAAMLRYMPEPVADTTLDVLGEPTDAERAVSPDVATVLGRAPAAFADWAARNAAAFR